MIFGGIRKGAISLSKRWKKLSSKVCSPTNLHIAHGHTLFSYYTLIYWAWEMKR